MRLGAISLVVLLAGDGGRLQPPEVPGLRGHATSAEFTDASGLHKGNMVQVGGIRVGRVEDIELEHGDNVVVDFEVDHGVEFGDETQASVEVLNLLGEKYLELHARRRRPAATADDTDPGRAAPIGATTSSASSAT